MTARQLYGDDKFDEGKGKKSERRKIMNFEEKKATKNKGYISSKKKKNYQSNLFSEKKDRKNKRGFFVLTQRMKKKR